MNKNKSVTPIQNGDAAEKAMERIRQAQGLAKAVERQFDPEIEALQKQLNDLEKKKTRRLRNLSRLIHREVVSLYHYIVEHGHELRKKGRIYILPGGSNVLQKLNPPKLVIRNEKVVIEVLKKLKLFHLIRVFEEVEKDRVKKYLEQHAGMTLAGARVEQVEMFVVQPRGASVDVRESVSELKVAVKRSFKSK